MTTMRARIERAIGLIAMDLRVLIPAAGPVGALTPAGGMAQTARTATPVDNSAQAVTAGRPQADVARVVRA